MAYVQPSASIVAEATFSEREIREMIAHNLRSRGIMVPSPEQIVFVVTQGQRDEERIEAKVRIVIGSGSVDTPPRLDNGLVPRLGD